MDTDKEWYIKAIFYDSFGWVLWCALCTLFALQRTHKKAWFYVPQTFKLTEFPKHGVVSSVSFLPSFFDIEFHSLVGLVVVLWWYTSYDSQFTLSKFKCRIKW